MNMNMNGDMAMEGNMPHSEDHGAFSQLINSMTPTHEAINSGAWSDANTWKGGKIPGEGAKALIAEGTTVTYDQISDARLETIAIEGNLKFATNQDTQLYVETILNGEDGKLDIGSEDRSVAVGKRARIVFTSDRSVNTAWDPTQLSKGLVSHGEVNIYGADKTEKATLKGNAAAGNNVLTFEGDISSWAIGDKIALGGTGRTYQGLDADNSRLQDEVLTITEINGNSIRFTNDDIKTGDNTVLRYDHTANSYAKPGELKLYAANLTRNVSFETENGKDVPLNHRAHVMLMHNPNVTVNNAGFYDLGRSDKTKLVDDVGENVDGSKGNGTNIRGRYAFHLHQTGVEKQAAIVKGNVVSGSTGWGFVQHESRAGLENNIAFDVVGAGIVAESGNEQGWWTDNLVMKTTGIDWQTGQNQREAREKRFDLGFEGDGYWIQGAAQIENKDNKAISANRLGMALFGGALDITNTYRPVEYIDVASLPADVQKLVPAGQTKIDIRDVPMADVTGFEAYNSTRGLQVWGHKTNFDGEMEFSHKNVEDPIKTAHLGRSRIEDFKLWNNTWGGADVSYSSNIDLKDGLILAKDDQWSGGGSGLFSNHATFNATYDGLTIEGFEQGANFEYLNNDKDFVAPTLKNSRFKNNKYNLTKVGDEPAMEGRPDDYASFITLRNNQFEAVAGNAAPTARFSHQAIGGLAVELDASISFDADPLRPEDSAPGDLPSNGIAAYGWDLNNDGQIDQFGRTIKPVFAQAGDRTIALTVIDSQGESSTTTQNVSVQPTAYSNAFENGSFSSTETIEPWKASSQFSDQGWYMTDNAQVANGFADLSKPGVWNNHIGQVVRNQKIHRGDQTLSFRLKNIEGEPDKVWKSNEVAVELWGINGQFYDNPWDGEGPQQVGTLPMQRTLLASDRFGGENGDFFNWKDLSYGVNLGQGYDYLAFRVKGDHLTENGDDVALDNVSLMGDANVVSEPLTELPTELPSEPLAEEPQPIVDLPPAPTNPTTDDSLASPVAELSFEEGSGRIANDTSDAGQNNNLTLNRGVSWTEGKVGGAIALNGEQADAAFANSPDINAGTHDQRTVSLWFKADNASQNRKQVLYEEGGSTRGLNVYIEGDQLVFGGWNQAESKWNGSWIRSDATEAGIASGQWHHAALVLNGQDVVADNVLTAYLDGRQIGQAEGSQLWSHTDRIGLGSVAGQTRFEDAIGTRQGTGFAGAIDEVKIFNDALSANQIEGLAAA